MNDSLILCSDAECRFVDADVQRLRTAGSLDVSPTYAVDELARRVREADILVASCFAKIPESVIAAGARLRGIVKYGVGVDNIDLAAAAARGIPVANCPEYGSGTVADLAFALLIALARKLSLIDAQFRRHGWFWPDEQFCGVDLEGKTIGLIGMGRIGRKMARRAAGFDMTLLACDPYVDRTVVEREGLALQWLQLDELLAASDFVSVHCVLTPETQRLLGERELRLMRPTAYLIDVSRGAIIDEPALLRGLNEGWLAGAGLDVFADEPLAANHPLLGMPNVVVTPHLAWYTAEAAARQSHQAADAVLDLLAGRGPRSVVNGVAERVAK
ncbi:MAG: D-glycerate dehydrogenase [Planctomycetales bacterium]|nr:D-glycerate dehydrogenase [Planctomycetales bacterium]